MKSFKLTPKHYDYSEGRESTALPFSKQIKTYREQGITYGGISNILRLDHGVSLDKRVLNRFVFLNFTVEQVA